MKKACILTFSLSALAVAWPLRALDEVDTWLFSENNYGGTARSVAMGNAVTAVGGDIASLAFNPAGSMVANYSQVALTPGMVFSRMQAQGVPGEADPVPFGDKVSTRRAQWGMPSLGGILHWDQLSLGFLVQSTQNFTSEFHASGVNGDNSFAAALASLAEGIPEEVMGGDWHGDALYYDLWMPMAAYQSGMLDRTGVDGEYVALTELLGEDGDRWQAKPIFQKYGRKVSGGKRDFLVNLGIRLAKNLDFGVNLGCNALQYSLDEYWQEAPQNPAEFPEFTDEEGTTYRFEGLRMDCKYRLRGLGFVSKMGLLWHPVNQMRVGIAYQFPVRYFLSERYAIRAESSVAGRVTSPVVSPTSSYDFCLRLPGKLNCGLAYTFGSVGLLSLDYEIFSYGGSRYSARPSHGVFSWEDEFEDINWELRERMGISHALRLGGELRLSPQVALRAGGGFSALSGHVGGSSLLRSQVAFGLGYASRGPLYVDVAARCQFLPREGYIPYSYYYAPSENEDEGSSYYYAFNEGYPYYKEVDETVSTPEVAVTGFRQWDVLLTLGFRF